MNNHWYSTSLAHHPLPCSCWMNIIGTSSSLSAAWTMASISCNASCSAGKENSFFIHVHVYVHWISSDCLLDNKQFCWCGSVPVAGSRIFLWSSRTALDLDLHTALAESGPVDSLPRPGDEGKHHCSAGSEFQKTPRLSRSKVVNGDCVWLNQKTITSKGSFDSTSVLITINPVTVIVFRGLRRNESTSRGTNSLIFSAIAPRTTIQLVAHPPHPIVMVLSAFNPSKWLRFSLMFLKWWSLIATNWDR